MKRHFTPFVNELLSLFSCVALTGVRQSGKTTALRELPQPWQMYDLETATDYDVVARDPDLFFRLNPAQVALDEAQLLPTLFPALRVAIDADRNTNGRFLITGSSSPELMRSISESLAGRIAIVYHRQLKIRFSYFDDPKIIGHQCA
jgi:hypothetical protein